MSNTKIMYVGSFSFNKNNRAGNGYNFVEFSVDDKGNKLGRAKTLFSNKPIDTKGLTPGDIVECSFSQPEFLGANPALTDILVVEDSTVFD